jgi:MFS family permease
LIEEGFTRGQLSLANLILSWTVAILSPLAGVAMDRFGALRIISVAIIGEAVAFAAFAFIPPVFSVYVAIILVLALFGVGTTPPGFSQILVSRFERARGMALGIAVSGLGVVAIVGPIGANWLIEVSGWRGAYLGVAGAVVALGAAGIALIIADGPTRRDSAMVPNPSRTPVVGDWSALRRPLFWTLLLALLAPALFAAGYLFHLISILKMRGVDAGAAAQIQSLLGIAVLVGRLGNGWALDRFFAPHVAAFSFLLSALACLALWSEIPALHALAAIGVGLAVGAELDVMAYIISRYFGVENFGKLYGLAYGLLILCSGFSPLLITLLSPNSDYSLALLVSAVGTGAGALLIALVPRSSEPASPDQASY